MEKSMEVKSWKANFPFTSVTKFVSTKKNKKRIFDNQIEW